MSDFWIGYIVGALVIITWNFVYDLIQALKKER